MENSPKVSQRNGQVIKSIRGFTNKIIRPKNKPANIRILRATGAGPWIENPGTKAADKQTPKNPAMMHEIIPFGLIM